MTVTVVPPRLLLGLIIVLQQRFWWFSGVGLLIPMSPSPPPQVINFTMPSTIKHYVHRVGRTARAGRSGRSVSLVGESERKTLKEVVKSARNTVKARVLPPGTNTSVLQWL